MIAEAELSGGKIIVVRIGFGKGIGLAATVGVGFTVFFPLLQMSFLPDFMQVNIIPLDFEVAPALTQVAPEFIFAVAEGAVISIANNKIIRIASRRFIAS